MDEHAYYSLDDILADAEPIPVIFSTEAVDLGWFDEQSMDDSLLQRDARVELPLWLATVLVTREYVSLELPRVFQPAFREMLLAAPAVVDLQQKCAYFYEFGIKLATLINEAELGNTLCRSMNTRFIDIVRRTGDRKQAQSLEFVSRLAHMEKQLFESKQVGLLQVERLNDRKAVQLSTAPLLKAALGKKSPASSSSSSSSSSDDVAAAASHSARRRAAEQTGALRNITNVPQQHSRTAMHSNVASDRRAPGTADMDTSAKPQRHTALSHLTAVSSANQPLASHQQKRFGMAATKTQQQRTGNAAPTQAAAAPMHTAQSARGKRKMTQNM